MGGLTGLADLIFECGTQVSVFCKRSCYSRFRTWATPKALENTSLIERRILEDHVRHIDEFETSTEGSISNTPPMAVTRKRVVPSERELKARWRE